MSINSQNVGVMLQRWGEVDSGLDDQRLSGERYSDSSKSAEWMVEISSSAGGGVLTSSNNSTFPTYCRSMTNPFYSLTRRTNANTVDKNKYDSSRVRISNLLFAIPHDVWTPQIENILINGILVEKITFIRLTNQGQIDEIAETINFYDTLFQQSKQVNDILLLEARVEKMDRTTVRRNQKGVQEGQNAVSYDVQNSIVTSGGGGGGGGGAAPAA